MCRDEIGGLRPLFFSHLFVFISKLLLHAKKFTSNLLLLVLASFGKLLSPSETAMNQYRIESPTLCLAPLQLVNALHVHFPLHPLQNFASIV